MIYQHPLAYLLGLEGLALLRAFDGDYDRDFTEARLAEIRTLLDSADWLGGGAETHPITAAAGYRAWASDYDQAGNRLIDLEQPYVRAILDGLPPGTALDAACGTGRHTEYLAALGHTVIGVDGSPEMLAAARAKIPGGEFREGDLHHLPVPDEHVDVVVCALALTHVPELSPVLAEFTRVLRPGATPPEAPVSHPSDIWSLQRWCPAATNASYRNTPVAIIWHFQRGAHVAREAPLDRLPPSPPPPQGAKRA